MQDLAACLKAEHPPQPWRTYLSGSSLTVFSPDRRYNMKIDSNRVFTIEIKKGLECKSNTFKCKTIEEAWSMVKQSVKAYTRHI